MTKKVLKIILSILSLIVIIPGSKLGFPVVILLLLKATEGALGVLFSFTILASLIYLFISALKKYNSTEDSIISLVIIIGLNSLLLTQLSNMLSYGDAIIYTLTGTYLILSIALTIHLLLNCKRVGRISEK